MKGHDFNRLVTIAEKKIYRLFYLVYEIFKELKNSNSSYKLQKYMGRTS